MKEKIVNFLTTPIKVSYRERSEYTKLDKVILNPVVMFLVVVLATWQAWEVSKPSQNLESDTALGNVMVYFERGDFDNAELQLSMIIKDYKGTKSAHHAKFYLGRIAFIDNNFEKASLLLKESVKKLDYPNLKTEAYIMLAEMEETSSRAISLFDSAQKNATSETEKNYISILKAKRMVRDNKKENALKILDSITIEKSAYKDMFEHVYGMALALN